jgi:hypothetical protein
MGTKILFKFILPPITKDNNILKNISIFQEINVISIRIPESAINYRPLNEQLKSIRNLLKKIYFQECIIVHYKVKLLLQLLLQIMNENCIPFTNFPIIDDVLIFSKNMTSDLNGKYLTLQIDMFFISGIMTPRRIQNPKRLTPAEKAKAKVNEYEEFPEEIQQKFLNGLSFLIRIILIVSSWKKFFKLLPNFWEIIPPIILCTFRYY